MYSRNTAPVFLSPFRKDDESIAEAFTQQVVCVTPFKISHLPLAQQLLQADSRENVTVVLVPNLLHADAVVRTASASLPFDIAAVIQRCAQSQKVKDGRIKPIFFDQVPSGHLCRHELFIIRS